MPGTLAESPKVRWQVPLPRAGLGGLAATDAYVVFGDRDVDDFHDVFRCLDANSGETVWELSRLAIGALDYGNSPRATPLIVGPHVYCLGAMGTLLCLQIADGDVVWERDLDDDFDTPDELPWGHCGSPLFVDGKIVVSPGGPQASLVALDAADGKLVWKTPGNAPSYGSLIVAELGGRRQIVGHDAVSLGGWDIDTGKRLWTVMPDAPGDFNVPTPIVYHGQLLITTENNGARLFGFSDDGQIIPQPVAVHERLRPDMSTSVVVADRLFCVKDFLFCLDLSADRLAERWRLRDAAVGDYAAVIASDDRLLVVADGQLLLLKTDGSKGILSRQRVFADGLPLYSHPAIVGDRLYLRGETQLVCIEL